MVSASLRNLQWSLERSLDVSDGLWEKPTRCIGRSADMPHHATTVQQMLLHSTIATQKTSHPATEHVGLQLSQNHW